MLLVGTVHLVFEMYVMFVFATFVMFARFVMFTRFVMFATFVMHVNFHVVKNRFRCSFVAFVAVRAFTVLVSQAVVLHGRSSSTVFFRKKKLQGMQFTGSLTWHLPNLRAYYDYYYY